MSKKKWNPIFLKPTDRYINTVVIEFYFLKAHLPILFTIEAIISEVQIPTDWQERYIAEQRKQQGLKVDWASDESNEVWSGR